MNGVKMSNDLLLYATKKTIDNFNDKFKIDMQDIHLYKSLYLLKREFDDEGINLRLPYYWYYMGPLMDIPSFKAETGVSFNEFAPYWPAGDHTLVSPTIDIENPRDKETIDDKIFGLMERIDKGKDLVHPKIKDPVKEWLLDSVYDFAPYAFQKTFRKFELSFSIPDYADSEEMYNLLVRQFPEDDFENISDLYLEWENVIGQALEMGKKDFIIGINRSFWTAFCH